MTLPDNISLPSILVRTGFPPFHDTRLDLAASMVLWPGVARCLRTGRSWSGMYELGRPMHEPNPLTGVSGEHLCKYWSVRMPRRPWAQVSASRAERGKIILPSEKKNVTFSPYFASRSYLDMYKVIIFSYLFWFVLTIIFITGTTRISIFCMGYLVACFYFLLFGGDLLLKPIRSILRYWDWLIAYNVFVITMKNILSVGSCCLSSALSSSVSLEVCAVLWVSIKNPFGTTASCKHKAVSISIQHC